MSHNNKLGYKQDANQPRKLSPETPIPLIMYWSLLGMVINSF